MAQFNPLDETHRSRLTRAREASYKQLKPFRDFRYNAYRELVGKHYGHDGVNRVNPINNLQLIVQIYTQNLISQNPAAGVTTKYPSLRPYATLFKAALNEQIEEMNLQHSLEQCIVETLFGCGIMKVGVVCTADDQQGFLHDAGMPFADPVLLEDWVHDMKARSFEEVDFCGNRYRVPLDEIKENPLYDAKVREKVTADSQQRGGVETGTANDSSNKLSAGTMPVDDDLHDHVELWDEWLPRDGLLITRVANQELAPLRVVEWSGPERGPFHMNPYQIIPGNIMPLAPMCGVFDLHVLINQLARKTGQQAERQRTVLAYQAGAGKDAERLQNAADGEAIRVDDVTALKEMRMGGADAANVSFMMQARQLLSYMAGNLDTMGGLGAMTSTVGQDELLAQNASQRLQDMQRRTQKFTANILRDIGFYQWDSQQVRQLELEIEGTGLKVQRYWGPDDRVGKFYQYNVDIVPYSMQFKTPEEIIGGIENTIASIAMPLMPILQQQGYTIDVKSLLEKISEHRRIPELLEVIVPQDPAQAQALDDEKQPTMPNSAQREGVTRGKGRMQKDPMMANVQQMQSDQRSLAAAGRQ